VTFLDAWLAGRRPVPPAELVARVGTDDAASSPEADGDRGSEAVMSRLVDRALAALDEARGAPGRVRESAYDLLVADALLTYACEAALETSDPSARLEELVGRAASPDR
jgi:hypothetical protein